jgi:hypothetical protein
MPLHSCPPAHALQAAPRAPQDVFDSAVGSSQVPVDVQHPGHDVPAHVHAPIAHDSPVPHALHAEPPVPHWVPVCDVKARHAPAAVQQPPGHDVASQAQTPVLLSHSCPAAHAAQLAPALPQAIAVSDTKGTHWPAALQHPLRQVAGLHAAASEPVSVVATSWGVALSVASPPVPSRVPSVMDMPSPAPASAPASQSPPAQAPCEYELRPSTRPQPASEPASSTATAANETRTLDRIRASGPSDQLFGPGRAIRSERTSRRTAGAGADQNTLCTTTGGGIPASEGRSMT